jgi:L-threonylcarbamoyladenylate synthase
MAQPVTGADADLHSAVDRLAAGQLVAFPTETVYGLGARADDDAAVAAIFAAKGRPVDHPLIVHVAAPSGARQFAADWPAAAERLAQAFWPGPMTLVVRRTPDVAEAAAGGQPTIGLRCPSHPLATRLLSLLEARGVPGVAAPSANRFGRISPTRAAHVREEFGPDLFVLDGGDCDGGIESTIVDCSRAQPVLLRPGLIGRDRIESVLQGPLGDRDAAAPRAPGTLAAHYAPRARLRLMATDTLKAAVAVFPDRRPAGAAGPAVAVYSRTVRSRTAALKNPALVVRVMPDDAVATAHELFAVLRDFDARGVAVIWVETPPPGPAWDGVRDRLQRAAAA